VAAAAASGKLGFEPRLLELIGEPPNYAAALMPMDDAPGEPIMNPCKPAFPSRPRHSRPRAAGAPHPVDMRLSRSDGAGALMSYGVNLVDVFRDGGGFVDQLAKALKAGDVPMRGPSHFTSRSISTPPSARPHGASDAPSPRDE